MTAFKALDDAGETDVTRSEGAQFLRVRVRVRKENTDVKMDRAFLKSVHLLLPGSIGYERHAFGLDHNAHRGALITAQAISSSATN
ncbi:hypothetical protein GCM10007382_18250 [Salinibacterium xinjiangense]|uniref:Uncharacterized protein n=1 Tax=Salinibacterium xinjiangense TaxID=386302 RepID=A0A2C8YR15_9MICO|nr:hypothetical protein GCM10007382_18250 [Salinibacterium xinjiangense]SOE52945.1 hypothetical protein SAMN06296378_0482 [Salinibacterium xinjiangense]